MDQMLLSFTDFAVYRVTWLAPSLSHSSHEYRLVVMTLIIPFFLKLLDHDQAVSARLRRIK
jgi:hypothetical protein